MGTGGMDSKDEPVNDTISEMDMEGKPGEGYDS